MNPPKPEAAGLEGLLAEIAKCRVCEPALRATRTGHAPRPVLQVSPRARLRLIGQAPGLRVHRSGKPFDDPSGVRLRSWLGLSEEEFWDPDLLAITPMGLCFPGYDDKGADLPPRAECAPLYHDRLTAALPAVETTLLVGSYAQKRYLGAKAGATMTGAVAAWRDFAPRYMPLPHPSWRNTAWLKRHPWFEEEVLPWLRTHVRTLIGGSQRPRAGAPS